LLRILFMSWQQDISWYDLPGTPGKSGRRIAFEWHVDREENAHTLTCVWVMCVFVKGHLKNAETIARFQSCLQSFDGLR
jgi:hypothetical protein